MFTKNIIIILMLTIFVVENVRAELPYETDHNHTFVVTGGLKKNDRFTDNFQNSFNLNYSFQNKISVGISYRDFAGKLPVYEGFGMQDQTGYLEPDTGQYSRLERDYKYPYPDRTSYNLYAQVKPLNLLQINAPVLFSLFVAVQDVSDKKYFVGNVYIFKKFNLNRKQSLQPTVSIGYRDISYVSNNRFGKIGASLIYAYALNKFTSVLVAPQVYRFEKRYEFSIQAGISYGFGL